MTFKMNLFL